LAFLHQNRQGAFRYFVQCLAATFFRVAKFSQKVTLNILNKKIEVILGIFTIIFENFNSLKLPDFYMWLFKKVAKNMNICLISFSCSSWL
jgi:hypothetical protein